MSPRRAPPSPHPPLVDEREDRPLDADDWDDPPDDEDDLVGGDWQDEALTEPPEPWEQDDDDDDDEAPLDLCALPEEAQDEPTEADWNDDAPDESDWRGTGVLPAGLRLVGFRETVQLRARPDVWAALSARCETGSALSFLRVRIVGRRGDQVSFALGERVVTVACVERDEATCLAQLSLRVAGTPLRATVRLVDRESDVPLVLGRDLLAGRFVVDCG